MLTLRDLLAQIPAAATEVDLQSAKRTIKSMVKYARSRAAHGDRVTSYMQPKLVA